MAESRDKAKYSLFSKKDVDKDWAEFVVVMRHLKKERDKVTVTFPQERDQFLTVKVNDEVVCEKLLPGAVQIEDSTFEVSYGERGEVKVNLRKAESGYWMNRWSPLLDRPTP